MDDLKEKILDRCIHFSGFGDKECKAGVSYETVKDTTQRPFRWPCTRGAIAVSCPSKETCSEEEAQAEVDEWEKVLKEADENAAKGLCPTCGKTVEPRKQVGRCVYGACGHRLYQGEL